MNLGDPRVVVSKFRLILTELVVSRSNTSELYSEGFLFESRMVHQVK
jgi:hypothetical protein